LENDTLKVLDLSWNNLGGCHESQISSLYECLRKNKELVHLDLSCNSFTNTECIQISDALAVNKSYNSG
jgi:Ran GTPase-activating protein (RanGAP) involved in mRNA processing and transport